MENILWTKHLSAFIFILFFLHLRIKVYITTYYMY